MTHLVPTNAQADAINAAHLARLPAPAVTVQGTLRGEFRRTSLPTGETLVLKPGARIMVVANDPEGRWVNGDVGVITTIEATQPQAVLAVALDNGFAGPFVPYTWEVIRLTYDAAHDRIEAEVVGAFTQYPVRLAWALTIHKAQGKTLEQVCIDFGRGTFAHGQAYVALSRCTSLEGVVLTRRVEPRHIFIDRRVQQFFARVAAERVGAPPSGDLALAPAPSGAPLGAMRAPQRGVVSSPVWRAGACEHAPPVHRHGVTPHPLARPRSMCPRCRGCTPMHATHAGRASAHHDPHRATRGARPPCSRRSTGDWGGTRDGGTVV